MINAIQCEICPRRCLVQEGRRGFCNGRMNLNGEIVAENYGRITSMALDPIEKKPLRRFLPGSNVLSVGSYGCNMRCFFCQNYSISMEDGSGGYVEISPDQLAERARQAVSKGNIGIAYTYNEPLIGYEFVVDTAELIHKNGLKNVVVTNGYINRGPLKKLLPLIDAFNIDLKSFSRDFYKTIGGDLDVVKGSIELAAAESHVEVTTLIIEGYNDSAEEMRELSGWLASVDPEIPLHISRFYPAYKMKDAGLTPKATIYSLADIARGNLRFVYEGNV